MPPMPERAPGPPLSDDLRRFLEAPRVVSIATLDPDGQPRQAVVWYRLEADGRILLNSRRPRRWCLNLERDPRLALSIVAGKDGYRFVGLTGVVDEIVDDLERARADIIALAHRYHPEGPSAGLIAEFRTQERVTFLVRLTGIHDHREG
jgi:PPOX class probable F420-dependent enzyme